MTDKDYLPQYAAEAVRDLEHAAIKSEGIAKIVYGEERERYERYAANNKFVANLLRNAAHIVLPPNGEIYRDNKFTGPSEQECPSLTGLPAPITSFEFPWTHDLEGGNINPSYEVLGQLSVTENPPKRITLVVDQKQLVPEHAKTEDGFTRIIFMSVCYYESVKSWAVQPFSVTVLDPFNVYNTEYMSPDGKSKGWGTKAEIFDLLKGDWFYENEDPQKGRAIFSEYQGDISLVVQACHALRVGAVLEPRKEKSYTRNRTFEKKGVGGFEYHVLRLPHGTVRETLGSRSGGERDGPRYHFRRAHLRNLSKGTQTFVRSCFVGNREKGEIKKEYKLEPGAAA